MRNIFLIVLLLMVGSAQAQSSMGFVVDMRATSAKPMNGYFGIGMQIKKHVTTRLHLVTGISYRQYDLDVSSFAINNDFETHYNDVHPGSFYYLKGDYFRFRYGTIPAGIEYKVTPWLRLQYLVEGNFLISANKDTDEYLQYGKGSIAKFMSTQKAGILFHAAGVGIGFHAGLHPGIIRNDLTYTYQFMETTKSTIKNAWVANVTLWGDLSFIKRKKVL